MIGFWTIPISFIFKSSSKRHPLKKRNKGILMTFQKQKKMPLSNLPFIVQAKSKPRKESLKKRSERNVSNVPKTKKTKKFAFTI